MERALSSQTTSSPCRHFCVGQNLRGQWVAVDTAGACGGIFTSRAAALHFAELETDHRPGAVSVASTAIDLKI